MKLNHVLSSILPILGINLSIALTGCNSNVEHSKTNQQVKIEQALTAVQQIPTTNDDSIDSPQTSKEKATADIQTYSVAMVTSVEPYSFRGENSEITGFNVDVINAIAEAEGFEVDYLQQEWDGDFDYLTSDKHDMLGSLSVITPERQEFLDFSDVYITSDYAAAVQVTDEERSLDELIADTDVKFSVLPETMLEKYLLDAGVDNDRIVGTNTEFLGVRNVFSERSDAVFSDHNVLKYFANKYDGLKIVEMTNKKPLKVGFAVKKGNDELLSKINNGLETIKANGTYDTIHKNWFGS